MEYKKKRTSVVFVVWVIGKPYGFRSEALAKHFIYENKIKIEDYILEKVTTITERLEG